MGLTADDIINRNGDLLVTPAVALGTRNVMAKIAEEVFDLLKLARDDNPTVQQVNRYYQLMQTHSLLATKLQGWKTETGQMLNSFRIKGDATSVLLEQFEKDLIISQNDSFGGIDKMKSDAGVFFKSFESGNNTMKSLNSLGRKGFINRLGWTAGEMWVNNILAGPSTHVANIIGNTGAIGFRLADNGMTALISQSPLGNGELPLKTAMYQFLWFTARFSGCFPYSCQVVPKQTGI